MARRIAWLLLSVAVLGMAPLSASAQVPSRVPFQGLLLDDAGAPINAGVDLDFSLFDALVDGTSLWSESHLGVIVVDGVYSVDLGANTPLTRSVLAGGAAFLEITVDGETLVPRQQLLSVPFALVADEATTVVGVPSEVLEQVWTLFPFDQQAPANDDPAEGLADVDGDGLPNYLDPDNDDDGILDGVELAAGSSLNVFSPRIDSVVPDPVTSFTPTTLTVTGTNLGSLTSVTFGTETPAPTAVTATGFQIDVVAETLASSLTIDITIGNGEPGSSAPIPIEAVAPTIDTVLPPFTETGEETTITIAGTGFYPGTLVQIGPQSLVPTALSETSITVTLAPENAGSYTLEVIHPNTLVATRDFDVVGSQNTVFVTAAMTMGDFGGIAAGDAICQAEATAAGLAGTFRAWLSDSTSSPLTTFPTTSNIRFVLPNQEVVADDWSDLVDGTLDRPIDVRADGSSVPAGLAWTGTFADGSAAPGAGESCSDWTATTGSGRAGRLESTTSDWSDGVQFSSCSNSLRLYCFEQ